MFKVIWLLRRKPGITMDQFRNHYENSHARLAQKYFGDLMLSYKRNYKTETWGGGVPTAKSSDDAKGGGFGPIDWRAKSAPPLGPCAQGAPGRDDRRRADTDLGRQRARPWVRTS